MSLSAASSTAIADDVFIFSTVDSIRGVNLTQQTENFLTSSPFATGLNALAVNTKTGLVYYGSGTSVYRWNPALGTGASAHTLINNFANGSIQAPITNINSTSGSYLDGKWYVGSESSQGYIQDIYELTMSTDGRQVVSVRPLNLLQACNCSGVQIGGFGDVAAVYEGADIVLYGSSADLTGGSGTSAGRWKFNISNSTWTFLAPGAGGQMSHSLTGSLYSNVGNSIRTVSKTTGATGSTSLFVTSQGIYDFTSGFSVDFSDAAGSYGAAFHNLAQSTQPVYLGANPPDNEAGVLNSLSGSVDINGDDSVGIDDEDAVDVLAAINTSLPVYSFNSSCTSGAYVAAWIDLDLDGEFEANERNTNYPVSCTNGTVQMQWDNIAGATGGDSFMRIRISTDRQSIASPTGLAPDGEVEDHPVQINQIIAGSCPAGSTLSVYQATDLPKTIGPNANTLTTSSLSVPSTGNVVDVNVVGLNGLHYAVRDLIFDLEHAGNTTRLYGPTCNRRNHFNIGFDDQASGSPPCPPINGLSYPPSGSLSTFSGMPAEGEWILNIQDVRNRNSGRLDGWGLEICTADPVIENPDLVLAKSASVDDRVVTIRLVIRNSGDVDISDVQLIDNLDAVFGANNHTLLGLPDLQTSPAGYTVNTDFDGTAQNAELLSGSGVLAPDAEISVVMRIRVGQNSVVQPENYTNQAIVYGLSPQGESVQDLSGDGSDTSTDSDEPTLIVMEPINLKLSGRVFIDSSDDATISHDGIAQANELGEENRQIRLIETSTGRLIDTLVTNGNGEWSYELDAAEQIDSVNVVVVPDTRSRFVSEASAYTLGSVADGIVQVSINNTLDYSNINIGVVTQPTLNSDRSASVNPGTRQDYSHRFVASSHGLLGITLDEISAPAIPVWNTGAHTDLNCNGILDANDAPWQSSVAVTSGEVICVIVSVFVPSQVPPGAQQTITLTADLQLTDVAQTGHAVFFELENFDRTTVSSPGSGRLELDKTVRNLTTGDTQSVSNSASPGDTLEYQINYSNRGSGPITDLTINDQAPVFTSVLGNSVVCTQTPANLGCTPANAGASVEWIFTGELGAGQSGSVSYSVSVE